MLEYMKENLLVNLQYDQMEGQDERDSESKNSAAVARANRKQFRETSELIISIENLEKK